MSNDDRLNELEIRLAHQDQQIQELSEVLSAQYDKIDMLEGKLKRLYAKMSEQGSGTETPVDKPPHY